MGMTISEKILADHAGLDRVEPGDLIFAKVDFTMAHDGTGPLAIGVFRDMGVERVFDPERVALVNDHFVPAKDIKSATLSKILRVFAQEQGIKWHFEIGRSGICHTLLPDEGLVVPGDLVVGADSHSTTYGGLGCFAVGVGSTDLAATWALGETWFRVPETIKVIYEGTLPEYVYGKDLILRLIKEIGEDGALYKVIEFAGSVVENLPMNDRLTLTNMTAEAGGKAGIIEPDDLTLEYVRPRAKREPRLFRSDSDARYSQILEFDITDMEPQVAVPFSPANVFPISEVEKPEVDQVFIGSCTNGRIDDFRVAARIMKGHKVHPRVRMLCVPGSSGVYEQMAKEGLAAQFAEAGAVVGPPTCGACFGGHMGVLAGGEVGVFTINRNYPGRSGDKTARVYLVSPAVAAATAVTGRLTDPRELA